MSVAAVKWALQGVRGLTSIQRLVLVAFAEYADPQGRTTVSSQRVAEDLEMAPSNLSKYRAQLIGMGALKVIPGITFVVIPDVTPEITPVIPEITEVIPEITPIRTTNNHQLTTNKKKKKKKKAEHRRFMEVYGPYPRHVGRAAASDAFNRLDPDDDLVDRIVKDITTRTWSDDPRFIPHCSTYLNQRRWEDEPDPPPGRGKAFIEQHARPGETWEQAKARLER